MAIFARKVEAEDETQESISGRMVDVEAKNKKNATSSFDKLRTARGKRKEPPKPWGKKERYLVFFVLIFMVLIPGLLALSAREWKLPGFPRIILPSLEFFKGGTIILEGPTSPRLRGVNEEVMNNITSQFKEETKNLSGVYGLYVVDLSNGYSFGISQDETFTAASLIKLPVMAGMYMKQEAGSLNLDSKYTLKNSDKSSGSGSLYSKPEGYQITYRNLVQLMGKQSDNTAYHICKNLLGDEQIESVMAKIGMLKTSLADNTTTPKDVGTFFEELYRGNVLNDDNKNELLNNMTDTIYEQWLAAGVPKDVQVAHKFGREVHVVNDAGIVFANDRPYVVVIMTKGVVEHEADEVFPKLSKIVYENMISD
jgi:beta-lactamase class A